MKITRLAALAKEHKTITLIDTEGDGEIIRQHVMIGLAVYPLDGFPLLDEDELLTVLDVPVDKRMDYSVYTRGMWADMMLVTADNHHSDREASLADTMICTTWADVIPAYTQSGMTFVNAEYRRVIEKEKDVSWWSRTMPSGATLLVAKRGYQAIATIMPDNRWLTDDVCDDLWHIAQAARDKLEKRKGKEWEHEQQTMWRNKEDPQMLPDVRKLQAPVLPGDA